MSFLGHVHRRDDLKRAVLTGGVIEKKDWDRHRFTYLQSLKCTFVWFLNVLVNN